MKCGIDIANLVTKNEEIRAEDHIKSDGNPLSIVENVEKTLIESESEDEEFVTKADDKAPNEEKTLLNKLNKLEDSSKGKVKGSLLITYLKSANNHCLLSFLGISFVLSQMLANLADIWVAYW